MRVSPSPSPNPTLTLTLAAVQAQLKSVAQEMRGGFFPIRSSDRDRGSDSNGGSTTGFITGPWPWPWPWPWP